MVLSYLVDWVESIGGEGSGTPAGTTTARTTSAGRSAGAIGDKGELDIMQRLAVDLAETTQKHAKAAAELSQAEQRIATLLLQQKASPRPPPAATALERQRRLANVVRRLESVYGSKITGGHGQSSSKGSKSRFAPSGTDGATAQPQPQQLSSPLPPEEELLSQVSQLACLIGPTIDKERRQAKAAVKSALKDAAAKKKIVEQPTNGASALKESAQKLAALKLSRPQQQVILNSIAKLEDSLQKASQQNTQLVHKVKAADEQLLQLALDNGKLATRQLQMSKELAAAAAKANVSGRANRAAEERCRELQAELAEARGVKDSQAEGQLAGMAELRQKLASAKEELASAAIQMQQQQEQLQQANTDLETARRMSAEEQQAFAAWKSKAEICQKQLICQLEEAQQQLQQAQQVVAKPADDCPYCAVVRQYNKLGQELAVAQAAAAREDGGSDLAERAFEVKCLTMRLEHQVRLLGMHVGASTFFDKQ
eukprot:gene2622-2923_t